MSLAISPQLDPLPMAAVTQKFACLGISGSGKTYGAGKFTECLLDAGAQVVIVDTIGNWGQGLRLSADGKKPGIAIPILGGEHGDVPLDAEHGELAAATVVDTLSPLVLDVSDFTKGELARFVTDFATELLTRKKRSKSPVMVVWEECQDIVPQMVRGDKARMVGAVEALIKKGRNYGVGTMLISQRAAAVNKDVLNQIETLFAFRQNSKHDRLAVRDWIVSQAIDVENLAEQLPTLKTGECFCWSPSWLSVLKKIKFGKKRTFDASRTPDAGDYVKPGELAPVDLEAFKATMLQTLERTKADDPKALRARVAELEQQLKTEQGAHDMTKVAFEDFVGTPPAAAFDEQAFDLWDQAVRSRLLDIQGHTERQLDQVFKLLDSYREESRGSARHASVAVRVAKELRARWDAAAPVTNPKPAESPSISAQPPAHQRSVTNGDGAALGKVERLILTALAQQQGKPMTRDRLALLIGYHANTKSFTNGIGALRSRGAVDGLAITDTGLAELGHYDQLPRGRRLLEWYCEHKLSGPEARVLRAIAASGPGLTREKLAGDVGYHPNAKSFTNGLGRLRGLGLVEGLQLSAELR